MQEFALGRDAELRTGAVFARNDLERAGDATDRLRSARRARFGEVIEDEDVPGTRAQYDDALLVVARQKNARSQGWRFIGDTMDPTRSSCSVMLVGSGPCSTPLARRSRCGGRCAEKCDAVEMAPTGGASAGGARRAKSTRALESRCPAANANESARAVIPVRENATAPRHAGVAMIGAPSGNQAAFADAMTSAENNCGRRPSGRSESTSPVRRRHRT